MSYLPTIEQHTNIDTSIITAGTPTSVAVNGRFSLSGTVNGSASITSNRLTLPTGSSYYLEGSILSNNDDKNGAITWQWYDNTNNTYIGSEGFINYATSFGAVARVARRVACAFILDSDITASSIDVELRIKSLSGTSWNLTIQTAGIDGKDYVGYPSIRILELPT